MSARSEPQWPVRRAVRFQWEEKLKYEGRPIEFLIVLVHNNRKIILIFYLQSRWSKSKSHWNEENECSSIIPDCFSLWMHWQWLIQYSLFLSTVASDLLQFISFPSDREWDRDWWIALSSTPHRWQVSTRFHTLLGSRREYIWKKVWTTLSTIAAFPSFSREERRVDALGVFL